MSIPSQSRNSTAWRPLYRAAILETDFCSVEQRISTAEEAIAVRFRELTEKTGQQVEVEREALDDALYTLNALRKATPPQVSAAA
jgi:hypothetical protein